MATNSVTKISEEEYLALDRAAEFRSEYVNGEMFAMAGTSLSHFRLQRNISGELYNSLRGSGCEAGGPDLRVRVSRSYVYPDIVVICGPPILADDRQDILLNPSVIVEILSPSTETYDRVMKFEGYRALETLKDYVLVDQSRVLIEHYVRQDTGRWEIRYYQSLGEELKIDSIGVTIPVQRIYESVEF
jgi:Uma2 family endonuclease